MANPNLPEETETFSDGAIGFSAGPAVATLVIAGVTSLGTASTLYGPYFDAKDIITDLGYGPAVQEGADQLRVSKATAIFICKVNGSVAGTNSSVTETGTSPTLTPSGTPLDKYNWKVLIITGGAVGTSTFQYSTDGGVTYSPVFATAASFVVPNTGVTLGFASGTYVAGDFYTFTSTAPFYSTTDASNAYNAADASATPWDIIWFVGQASGSDDATKASNSAAFFSTYASLLATSETNHHFRTLVMELPDVTDSSGGDSALAAQFDTLSNPRLACAYGFVDVLSPIDQHWYKRSSAGTALARVRVNRLRRDPAAVADGAVPNANTAATRKLSYHDENARQGPGTHRFITLRKILGKTDGAYVTNFPMMSAAGSDFKYIQMRRVIDATANVSRAKALNLLSTEIRTYPGAVVGGPSTVQGKICGTIVEEDAITIEQELNAEIFKQLTSRGEIISSSVTVNRSDLIQSTQDLRYKTRVKGWTYIKAIEAEFGFTP